MSHPAPDTRHLAVACVSASSALGGSEWSLLDFARRAHQHDIDLLVVLPKTGPFEKALTDAGVKVAIAAAPPKLLELSQRGTPGLGSLLSFSRGVKDWSQSIKSVVISHQPSVLYSNGFKAHMACALLGGTSHVWHLREFPPERTGMLWKALAAALPTAAIANSMAVARAWAVAGLRLPAMVHNGVDLDRFKPAERTFWVHNALEIDPAARLIGMPAVLARWKGHLGVVEAFEKAASSMPGVHLVFVGGAIYDTSAERGFAEELVARVRQAASARGQSLTDRIHFLKHQSEPWKMYPEFDVVTHFSTRPEPFGRVVVEAMACGVPVIATRAGGPMEIVEHEQTGWLVKPKDTAELARLMQESMDVMSSARADGIRQACRRRAEEHFSADRYAEQVAGVIKKAGNRQSAIGNR